MYVHVRDGNKAYPVDLLSTMVSNSAISRGTSFQLHQILRVDHSIVVRSVACAQVVREPPCVQS